MLARGDDPVRVGEIKLLNYQISVTLIGFDFPTRGSATQDSVKKSSFRPLLHGLSVGGGGSRPGSGASNPFPPAGDGSRANTLGLDLEPLLESGLEPLDLRSGADCGEVVPVQECSKISLAVVIQTWVVLTTLESQLNHLSGNLLLPIHRRIPSSIDAHSEMAYFFVLAVCFGEIFFGDLYEYWSDCLGVEVRSLNIRAEDAETQASSLVGCPFAENALIACFAC